MTAAAPPMRGRGRPSLGAAARSKQVMLRFKKAERAVIESVVESWNAALSAGERPLTIASWIRREAIDARPPGRGTT